MKKPQGQRQTRPRLTRFAAISARDVTSPGHPQAHNGDAAGLAGRISTDLSKAFVEACSNGDVDSVRLLLQIGRCLLATDKLETSPLHLAAAS